MTDFNKILEKAKEIEKKMKESQENLKKIEVDGVSGGDVVKITLNGDGEMTKILLSDKVLSEDKEIIQDLITAAHNDAKNKGEISVKEKQKNLKKNAIQEYKNSEEYSKIIKNFPDIEIIDIKNKND